MNEEKEIVRMNFGSVLYGTNTPNSDVDIKGVYIPSLEDMFLLRVPNSVRKNTKIGHEKNTKDDVDIELYPIQMFMKHLLDGQTVAIDMLFCPDSMILNKSLEWDVIVKNRERLLSKNIRAFVGYCRTQAAKYGIKGSRISVISKTLDFVRSKAAEYYWKEARMGESEEPSTFKTSKYYLLKDIFSQMPKDDEYIKTYTCPVSKQKTFEICGRKFQETVTLSYMIDCLEKILQSYGERAKLAEKNENIDWKAVSHAFRVCYEVKELMTSHFITFPLKEAEFVKKIKSGVLNYKNDRIGEQLEDLMQEVEDVAAKSDLPEEPDKECAENIIKHFCLWFFDDNEKVYADI